MMKLTISTQFWENKNWQEKVDKILFILLIPFMANVTYAVFTDNVIIGGINTFPTLLLLLMWRSYTKWSKEKRREKN